MKNSLSLLLAFALTSSPSQAAQDPIEFSARIQQEDLAEEAIDFLHCLSDKLEMPWELGEGGKAPYRLSLKEEKGALEGKFISPSGEQKISLARGEANVVCEKMAPETEAHPFAPSQEAPESFANPTSAPKNHQWAWALGAVAVLAGGFLFWKTRQPDHRAFRMN